jgi:hypothetical protein
MRSLRDDLSLSFRRLTKHVSLHKDDFKDVYEQTKVLLVEFNPDDPGPPRFRRHVFRLSEAPKFDALSYTSPYTEQEFECDKEFIYLPTALPAYLRSLHRFRPIRYLWTGSYRSELAIIYRKAARTICFTGFEDFGSLRLLTGITRGVEDYQKIIVGLLSSTDIYHSTYKIGAESLEAFEAIASLVSEDTKRDLYDFFNQTYFRRYVDCCIHIRDRC